MDLLLAWRNIWRNPRRTVVILIAIVIGVWIMVFTGAYMRGVMNGMIENGISTMTGSFQIQNKGYNSDPVIENSIDQPELVRNVLEKNLPPGAKWTSRIQVNAFASNARHSSGITLAGIDPEREAKVSFIGKDVIEKGRYLKPDDKYKIVVGKALLDDFETKIGNKLVLMSQNTNNDIASNAFRIVGVFRAEMESTEKNYVFITRQDASRMLKLDGVSVFSVLLEKRENLTPVVSRIRDALKNTPEPEKTENYVVLNWRELLPLVNAYLDLMGGFSMLWYIVVFIAMGFGIVNTMLMAVYERMREFGLLKALGMKPFRILKDVVIETLYLLIIGGATGNFLAIVSISILGIYGIDLSAMAEGAEFAGISRIIYPSLSVEEALKVNAIVFILGLVISLYPAIKAARITPVKAMMHY